MDCERLLARCFENYYSLSETAASGVLEGGQATTQIPAPALKPAVQLCSKLPHATLLANTLTQRSDRDVSVPSMSWSLKETL